MHPPFHEIGHRVKPRARMSVLAVSLPDRCYKPPGCLKLHETSNANEHRVEGGGHENCVLCHHVLGYHHHRCCDTSRVLLSLWDVQTTNGKRDCAVERDVTLYVIKTWRSHTFNFALPMEFSIFERREREKFHNAFWTPSLDYRNSSLHVPKLGSSLGKSCAGVHLSSTSRTSGLSLANDADRIRQSRRR